MAHNLREVCQLRLIWEWYWEDNWHWLVVLFVFFFVQELHELVRLHHEVQLLSLQLHVKQLAGEKLLPLLEKMDPLDRLG